MTTTRRLSIAATSALLPLLMGAAFLIPALTHTAPEGDFVGDPTIAKVNRQALPVNTPTWDWVKKDYPQCDSHTDDFRPKIVMTYDRKTRVMPFDAAVDLIDRSTPNSVWVLGSC